MFIKNSTIFRCYFLISFVNKLIVSAKSLPIVTGLRVTFLEPVGVFVEWDRVSNDELNRVKGYKAKLWSIEEKTTRHYKLLNGEQYPGLERNDMAQEPFSKEHISKGNLNEITTVHPYHIQARFNNIMMETLYELRVAAYNDKETGPLSDPIRLKIVKSKTDYTMSIKIVKPRPIYKVLAQRRLDSCGVSIITNLTDGDPFIHNSFI